MSGHSKWANIKHKKEKTDAQKGKIFTKLGREIAIAVRQGGADPAGNSRLSDIIAKAKASNVPNDNIMRSIKKAAGDMDGANYEEISYEGYGAGGVAVIVDTLTDNRNRTAGDVRHCFDKYGGNLGTTGCVGFLFEKKGMLLIDRAEHPDEDTVMNDAIEAGAEDFSSSEDYCEIVTDPSSFSAVRQKLEKKGYTFMDANVGMVPKTWVKLADPGQAEMMEKIIEHLEDLDDVQNVWHNWESDE